MNSNGHRTLRFDALHDRLDFGAVLVVVSQRRQSHLGLTRLAIAQDQQTCSGHALGQHLAAERGGGQRRKPRVQRGEYGFTKGGHESSDTRQRRADIFSIVYGRARLRRQALHHLGPRPRQLGSSVLSGS